MSESTYRRRETNPGYIRLHETRPTRHGQPPPKVLLVEARTELRELLSGLLERRGMDESDLRDAAGPIRLREGRLRTPRGGAPRAQ